MKPSKILIRIGLALLVLVTAVLAVRGVLQITEGRKVSRALAGLKAAGVPLTIQDLIPPCADSENGAALWRAAEELYTFDGEDNKLIGKVNQSFARTGLVSPEERTALGKLIEKNRRMLDLIPEVGAKPRFQYGDRALESYERRIPDAIKVLRAVRLLGFEAFLAAERGEMRSSLESLRAGLRFAPKIAEESSLIAYLVALADAKQCLLFLNKALSGREAGEDLLLPLLGDFDDRQIGLWKALLKNSIRGERVMFLDIGMIGSPKEFRRTFGGERWWSQPFYWLIWPLIKRDLAQSLPAYSELETQTGLPYYQTRDFWTSHVSYLKGLPWYAYVSKLAIPDMNATCMKVATFDALVLTTRSGLACRIHKGRTGQYPESLEALVPSLLNEVPIDPFTGKPLVYRRPGEGFIVYSLGSNLKDDGGRSTWEITQLVMDKDDDWTWKEDK